MDITIKDTVTISLDFTQAHCSNKCHIKYARKLINDRLKVMTDYKGGWTVYLDHVDDERYWFKLSNPYLELAETSKEPYIAADIYGHGNDDWPEVTNVRN